MLKLILYVLVDLISSYMIVDVAYFILQSFSSPLSQVRSRIWLMHWSLFIFFNHDNGRTQIIDLFNQDKYDIFSYLCMY